jgi:ribosomal protein S18 acetylase RimI-like enzyme
MTDNPRIELVGPESAALVHALMTAAFAEYRGRLEPPTGALGESVEDVARAIAAGGAVMIWLGETAAGAMRFSVEPDHLYVGRLAVLPAYRRLGLAARLMTAAEAQAIARSLPEVRVEVRSALPANVAFFERIGFTQREIRPHPRHPTATSVLMAKPVR